MWPMCIFYTGLGCSFLNEQCTNKSVYPYLCGPSDNQQVCTADHLTKVCIIVVYESTHKLISFVCVIG